MTRRLVCRCALLCLALLMAPAMLSCDMTTFTILEGRHRAVNRMSLVTKDALVFQVMFDESAIYATTDPANQADINKLYGFSDCNSHHQTNSARFGWRWLNNQLEILTYVYKDEIRTSKSFGAIPINETLDYALHIEGSNYVFTLNGHSITMERGCSDTGLVKYMLWPYFGGDETAPHDITIWLEEDD